MSGPFEYKAPNENQIELIKEFRLKCNDLYEFINSLPVSRERSIAITKLEEVSMWGNKGIVFSE